MRTSPIPLAAVVASLVAACGRAPSRGHDDALPPGVVARVGPVDAARAAGRGAALDVSAEHVARVAAEQAVPVPRARDLAVTDAVFAREALDRGLDRSPDVAGQIRGELARRMLRRLLAEARVTPPTEGELREAAARKWLDVDRPEGFRTVHAVVQIDTAKAEPEKLARARAVADAIHAAVEPVSARAATMPLIEGAPHPTERQIIAEDPDPLSAAFRKAASAVPRDGFDVVVQPLPAVAADGRVLAPGGGMFLVPYAAAAAALPTRGALSPVSESAAGLHVILLLERSPATILTGEERTRRLRDDIVNERARAAEKRLLAGLRAQRDLVPEAPGLLDLVVVEP